MNVHKLRITWYRYRWNVAVVFASFILMTTLMLQVIMIREVLQQSRRNEEILQGLACILLTRQEDRTRELIARCIEDNRTPADPPFKFNNIESLNTSPTTSNSRGGSSLSVTSKPQKQTIVPSPVIKAAPAVEAKPLVPTAPSVAPVALEVEEKVNELGQKLWRYKGELLWNLYTVGCEITNTCY